MKISLTKRQNLKFPWRSVKTENIPDKASKLEISLTKCQNWNFTWQSVIKTEYLNDSMIFPLNYCKSFLSFLDFSLKLSLQSLIKNLFAVNERKKKLKQWKLWKWKSEKRKTEMTADQRGFFVLFIEGCYKVG